MSKRLIIDYNQVYFVQHILQAHPCCLDSDGLHHPPGDPLRQQEPRPRSLWARRGLAHHERGRHLSLHVGQTKGKKIYCIVYMVEKVDVVIQLNDFKKLNFTSTYFSALISVPN